MHRKTLVLGALLALASAAQAQIAGSQTPRFHRTNQGDGSIDCYSAAVPCSTTNWIDSVLFPAFDPALGTLTGVEISISAHVLGTMQVENTDQNSPAEVHMSMAADLTLFAPDSTRLLDAHPKALIIDMLAPFDGAIDFAGPSGRTYPDLMASSGNMAFITDSAILSQFVGLGPVALQATGTGSSSVMGGANIVFAVQQEACLDVILCYHYSTSQGGSPPITHPDFAEVCVGECVIVDVLANDFDPDGDLDPSSLVIVAPPFAGTAVITPDFRIQYCSDPGFGPFSDVVLYGVADLAGNFSIGEASILADFIFCTGECPEVDAVELWPPNHAYHDIDLAALLGGDPSLYTVTAITQDEPINSTGDGNTTCDGTGVGTPVASVRAERKGNGNGRVYHVQYEALSPNGGFCQGTVVVQVPHSQNGAEAVDDGQAHDSTAGCP